MRKEFKEIREVKDINVFSKLPKFLKFFNSIFHQSGDSDYSTKSPFVSVAVKARAEQVYLLCRAAATKRSAANLKGDLEGL